jgi:hypothetical protein
MKNKNLDPNAKDSTGNPPMHTAISFHSLDAVRFFINYYHAHSVNLKENNFDPRFLGHNNKSPVFLAAELNEYEALNILLNESNGIFDPNIPSPCNTNITPIYIACANGSDNSLKLLLGDQRVRKYISKDPDHVELLIFIAKKHKHALVLKILLVELNYSHIVSFQTLKEPKGQINREVQNVLEEYSKDPEKTKANWKKEIEMIKC